MTCHILPAALGLGTFVNFTNCRVSYPYRRVNVTSIWIDPYPLPLREINRIKITAETNYNITLGKMILNTFSVPLVLNPVHDEFHLCRDHTVTTCPVTAGPMVINIPVVINGADHYVREYFAEILLIEELINQTMCVTFRYLVRDPEFSTGILAA
uniref:MD-2-related lipid-recognition domain-containing protein n=1 Tax=Brassica campestris TaxID=3711 RepID=M4D1J1_BRACM